MLRAAVGCLRASAAQHLPPSLRFASGSRFPRFARAAAAARSLPVLAREQQQGLDGGARLPHGFGFACAAFVAGALAPVAEANCAPSEDDEAAEDANDSCRASRARKKAAAHAHMAELVASGKLPASAPRPYSDEEFDFLIADFMDWARTNPDGSVNPDVGVYAGVTKLHEFVAHAQLRAYQNGHGSGLLAWRALPQTGINTLKIGEPRRSKVTGEISSPYIDYAHALMQRFEIAWERYGTSLYGADVGQHVPKGGRLLAAESGVAMGRVDEWGSSSGYGSGGSRLSDGECGVEFLYVSPEASSQCKLAGGNPNIGEDYRHGTGGIGLSLRIDDWRNLRSTVEHGCGLSLAALLDFASIDLAGGVFAPTFPVPGQQLENMVYAAATDSFSAVPPTSLWSTLVDEAPKPAILRQAAERMVVYNRRQREMDDGAVIQANLDVGWYTAEEEPEMREAAAAPFMRQRKDKRHTH